MSITSSSSTTSTPMYAHTLSEFITAGNRISIIAYKDLCFKEKVGSIIFVARNILQDYLPELKKKCITITLSDLEQKKYRFNPKRLAGDIYGSTDYYYIILMLNDIIDIKDFDNLTTLQMLTKADLSDSLSTIYSAEKDALTKFNSKHT